MRLFLLLTIYVFTGFKLPKVQNEHFVVGRIIDDHNTAMARVVVEIKGTKVATISIKDGYYKLAIPDSFINRNITLVYRYPSLKDFNKAVKIKKSLTTINVELVNKTYETGNSDGVPKVHYSSKKSRQIR